MEMSRSCPAPLMQAGEVVGCFAVRRVEEMPGIRVTAYEWEHLPTGAEVIHLHCDDRENLYAVAFRTPPFDATGLPHILEHCVLAGSERYPVKDAFNELVRGTLQTFINAFTYPDRTVYPVASQVKADFYNLARVYTDLVLRPRLLPETFRQEGHHLEVRGGGELTVSGIVYNEMKGAYSSPESLMFRTIQEHVFPDTAYRNDAGGNPDLIPSLTYEAFRDFHRRYYSPSNARIFLYGDISPREHLDFLGEVLEGFGRMEVDSTVALQRPWHAPRSVRASFPIGREEDPRGKAMVNLTWLLAESGEVEQMLILGIVSGCLVGSAAGPLRKALIDSSLGEDLSPATGMDADYRQALFTVGLRGTEAQRADRIEGLVLDTLGRVVAEGLDPDLVEGVLHLVEFGGREIVRKNYPYGLVLMGRVFPSWFYDGDPLKALDFPRLIGEVRERWSREPRLFEETIRAWFLDNPHRLLTVMEPDAGYLDRQEERFRRAMEEKKAGMSREEMEEIAREAERLRAFQEEPDTPAALATLPRLRRSDLERRGMTIPTECGEIGGVPVLAHDIFTNGIAYLDLAWDVSHVPDELQPLIPLLGKLTTGMGAAGRTYEEMAKLLALKTGGVTFDTVAGLAVGGEGKVIQRLIFRLKVLYRNIPAAVALLADLLHAGDLTDLKRASDLIRERKNNLQAAVVPSGHLFARRLAASPLNPAARREEQWHGRQQLSFVRALAERCEGGGEEILHRCGRLREMIMRRSGLIVNITADREGLEALRENLSPLLDPLGEGGEAGEETADLPAPVPMGVIIPAQVSYVARVWPAASRVDETAAALAVAARLIANGFLYRTIRVQGGAYGAMAQFDPSMGTLSFLSYRDPRIVRTLGAFDEAVACLCGEEADPEEVEKAVIGTIGALDRPMDPSSQGLTALVRHLAGYTDELRQGYREAILAVEPAVLRRACEGFFAAGSGKSVVVVLGDEGELRRANEALGGKLTIQNLTEEP